KGRTALHNASESGHLDIARLLLGHASGADVDAMDWRHWAPLFYASIRKYPEIA
ncbi:hypothetical protein EDB84DRAFT_1276830, partial [Lactarius hengduanensis]